MQDIYWFSPYNMSIYNILVVILMISLATLYSIQAEVIRGVDIQKINVTRIAGKWYLLTCPHEKDRFPCTTELIEKQSENTFITNTTYSFEPGSMNGSQNFPDESLKYVVYTAIQKDSGVIIRRDNEGDEMAMVIFDVDYNSYMAIYLTHGEEPIYSGRLGVVFIFGRQKILSNSIIEKIKRSNFYQQGVPPDHNLTILNTTNC